MTKYQFDYTEIETCKDCFICSPNLHTGWFRCFYLNIEVNLDSTPSEVGCPLVKVEDK